MIKEHLSAFLVEADIPEFATYNEVIAFKLNLLIPVNSVNRGRFSVHMTLQLSLYAPVVP